MRLTKRAAFASALMVMLAGIPAGAQESLPWQGNRDGAYGQNGTSDSYRDGGGYQDGYRDEGYRPNESYPSRNDAYRAGGEADYGQRRDSYASPQRSPDGYGEPYSPPSSEPYDRNYGDAPPPSGPPPTRMSRSTYEQGEIITAGHRFFGSISEGLAKAVEYAFKSQGRPNGYILGQDAGGAFVFGLRYGEGTLYTKDAGTHPVFWQGPSLGYDAGAEGSKTMVLVYNLRDPSEIYHRFAGVQGAAYVIGGVSVQFQKYGDVMLGVIRSGVGLRLGANVGYLKYTRTPTWNPL